MKFSTREELEAPIEAVFPMLSDFAYFERAALRRGIDIQRQGDWSEPGVGMAWDLHFELQGKPRDLKLVLETFSPPDRMYFDVDSAGMTGRFTVDLKAIAATRTEMAVAIEVAPRTMAARLLLQPIKLAKSSLTTRFKQRVAEYARELEGRHQRLTKDQSRPASAG